MKVLIVSTHRSDKAHYAPLIKLLRSDPRFELSVHDRFIGGDYDVAVVLGDRYEMLQAAAAIVEARIKLVHIHGGEHTYGSLDERYRWAMTMLADRHCVATEQEQVEVDKHILGQAKPGFTDCYRTLSLKTYVTGAPGLDDLMVIPSIGGYNAILAYNPAIDRDTTVSESASLFAAVAHYDDVLYVRPNGDRYSDAIPWSGTELALEQFRTRLSQARVIVGNSSAGIIEAPSFGTWAINVGHRQDGRLRGLNVIDVPDADPDKIRAALKDCLTRGRAPTFNPYNVDGKACERIREVLLHAWEVEA